LDPNPYYGPKEKNQDIKGLEMEKKYTDTNLRQHEGGAMARWWKSVLAKAAEENARKGSEEKK
jgi:hypothetical protein